MKLDEATYKEILRIGNLYPAIRSHKDAWPKVRKLVVDGKADEAAVMAKKHLEENPRYRIRNIVAVAQRKRRREYLLAQVQLEKDIKAVLVKFTENATKWITTAGGEEGKIPFWKMKPLTDRLLKANREAFQEIKGLLYSAVRSSIKRGIVDTMRSAQDGLNEEKRLRTGKEADFMGTIDNELLQIEEEAKATMDQTSSIYRTIFDAVAKRRIEQGLFKNRKRGEYQTGFSLSRAVWEIRDAQAKQIRRTVATGIASGRASSSISSDIKQFTVMGGQPRMIATFPTGAGVYRTAYKNALRLARTETNNAYHEAEIEYATRKGYQKMWVVAIGKRDEDECDILGGQIFDPEDVPPLPHPNCSCSLSTVLPEIG